MAAVFERYEVKTLREQVGSSMDAPTLKVDVRHVGHADRIAALGAASVARGIQREGRLSAMLWRIKLNNDRSQLRPAAILFAAWMLKRPEFRRWKIRSDLGIVRRFALLVLVEWHAGRPCHAAERAAALQIPMETYTQHWPIRFDWAKSKLDVVDWSIHSEVQKQLSRSSVAA